VAALVRGFTTFYRAQSYKNTSMRKIAEDWQKPEGTLAYGTGGNKRS
jgi:hypothetical protein